MRKQKRSDKNELRGAQKAYELPTIKFVPRKPDKRLLRCGKRFNENPYCITQPRDS